MAESDKDSCENFVLIINCSKCLSSEEFITQITKDKFSTRKLSNGCHYHPWKIENKYYCADVKLIVITNREEKPDWLTKKELEITAIVIVFDQVQSSFEEAKEWLPDVEAQDASVLLLVGSKSRQPFTNNEDAKDASSLTSEVLKFSIKHSFEFVDLNEEVDPEDDFPDTVGFARIVQALQATEWPSLQMKGQTTTALESESAADKEKSTSDVPETDFNTLHDAFDGVMEEADLDGEPSFDKLFSQMKLMKDKAESLPHSERKAYAEQVNICGHFFPQLRNGLVSGCQVIGDSKGLSEIRRLGTG